MKVLQLPPAAGTGPTIRSLRQELAVLLHTTQHCHYVCRYLGLTVKEGRFCIVMKLYPESLFELILRQPGRSAHRMEGIHMQGGLRIPVFQSHLEYRVCHLQYGNVSFVTE